MPLILEAAVSLLLGCPLAQDERVHLLRQSKSGAESLGLYVDGGPEYHFRPDGGHEATSILVKDSYRNGALVAKLDSSEAIWHFFAGLKASA